MDNETTNTAQILENAHSLYESMKYEDAAGLYMSLTEDSMYAAYAYYMLADISNKTGDPATSKDLYYQALTVKPDLFSTLLPENHPNHSYVFTGKKPDLFIDVCPLCGIAGNPIWCYPTIRMGAQYVQNYNPVRLWMYCEDCHHIYADEFPEQKVIRTNLNIDTVGEIQTDPPRFANYSQILSKLSSFTRGMELLEIGLGGCECSLVAIETGYNVYGMDISEATVLKAKKYGINAELQDFINFNSDKQWDIIIFGDVLEHVSDPIIAINKLYDLLKDDGVLWISTPNFDSAHSICSGHNDVMRIEVTHKNYFSRISLFGLLEKCGFIPLEYLVSKQFRGSMEVVVVKDTYNSN